MTNTIFAPLTDSAFRAFYINPGVDAFVFKDNTITGQFGATSMTQAKAGLVQGNTVNGVYPGGGDSRGLQRGDILIPHCGGTQLSEAT